MSRWCEESGERGMDTHSLMLLLLLFFSAKVAAIKNSMFMLDFFNFCKLTEKNFHKSLLQPFSMLMTISYIFNLFHSCMPRVKVFKTS